MSDVVFTAGEVGQIVQFIAPGFFARSAYLARFPQPEPSAIKLVVWSVAASLPLVALGNWIAGCIDVEQDPTNWQYVLVLLLPALLIGYGFGALRSVGWFRQFMGWLGLHHQPDGSLYALTMLGLPRDAVVVLELDDGRKVSGTPRAGPSYAEDDVDELVLTHPEWLVDGKWTAEGAGDGLLVPLSKLKTITFSEDPFYSAARRKSSSSNRGSRRRRRDSHDPGGSADAPPDSAPPA